MIDHKGYTGVFEYDPTIDALAGHVVDIRGEIYFEGGSIEEVKTSMRRAVDHYLEACAEKDIAPEKPFSGNILVRTNPSVHRAVAVAAAREQTSMNEWAERKLAEAAGAG